MKNVEDIYPLTPAQGDLLRESLAAPEATQVCWGLAGALDGAAFEAAWRSVLARHTAPRTCFLSEALERPVQVVRQQVRLPYGRHDLSGLEPDARRAALAALLAEERREGFNPARPPLFRLAEIKLEERNGLLALTHHPLLLDGRSASLMLAEALAIYGASLKGDEARLAQPVPYRAYVGWLERQDLAGAALYWRGALGGLKPAQPPDVGGNGNGAQAAHSPAGVRRESLGTEETEGLCEFARWHGLSVETLVAGAWALTLMRERGGREEVIGALVGGRPRALKAVESIVGHFENVLPLRVSYASGESPVSFLERIERGRADLARFAHVSESQIKGWCGVGAGARLYDSAVYVREPGAAREAEGAGLRVVESARYEATLGCPLVLEATFADRLSLTLHAARGACAGADEARLLEGTLDALRHLTFPAAYLSTNPAGAAARPVRFESPAPGGAREGLARVEAALRSHPEVREAVVVRPEADDGVCTAYVVLEEGRGGEPARPLDFSLFYFADDNAVLGEDKYRLYLEGARFADRHGLAAVWTPERHFHEKAGLYPNPSVLSAALATATERIGLRAGSVVMPLHNSLRVAEEWSVVDNLSRGRVGVSFTSGWMPNDFAFYPERYADKREEMFRGIEEVRELWRGRPIAGRDGTGKEIELRIFPKPIQPELPVWLTCSGDPKMFERAGELGCHVLTALLAQSLDDVAPKLRLYRESLARHGHDPAAGKVTMMMHTFLGEDPQVVLERVRAPLTNYLKSHVSLIETGAESLNIQVDLSDEQDRAKYLDQLAAFAFERYYRTASLIGTPTASLKMVERLRAAGVDEVACLIDFGVEVDAVLESLAQLVVLKELCGAQGEGGARGLGDFLAAEVPDFGACVNVVVLDALPHTAAGAVDYVALSAAAG